ncbi:hypothetical protein BGX34_010629 [Mortierella sp. NVP85]|nr:hypothetical protein BGX34_010629 [Mortierella sp. NVP85]
MDSDEDDDSFGQETAALAADSIVSAKAFSLDNLPSEFVAFLAKNEIDPAIYTVKDLPRYVRLNPDPQRTITPQELEKELGTKVEPVPGLEAFCRLSGQVKLRNTQAYKDGKIFGMDLSSGLAVYALDIQPGDHVLDICCAPGAKICMIAGLLTNFGQEPNNSSHGRKERRLDITGTVTGVDISQHRLSTCRSLLKRHRLQQYARLFRADGTTFGVMRPSAIDTIRAKIMAGEKNDAKERGHKEESKKRPSSEDSQGNQGEALVGSSHEARKQSYVEHTTEGVGLVKRSKGSKKALTVTVDYEGRTDVTTVDGIELSSSQDKMVPFHAPKMLRNDPQLQGEGYKYDKVIVDAECTHDGSIAHILKYETWGWDSFHKNFMSQDRLDSLCDLQRGLLLNGFRLTKKGGIVVYSTCSLSRAQNEDIVAWFLAKMKGKAVLEPLPRHALGIPTADCKRPCQSIISSALDVQSACDGSHGSVGHDEGRGNLEQESEVEQLCHHVMGLCLRYDPIASNTSGFFLARIRKIE